ncbi:ATP-dependent DNA helicase RecG [Brevibacterium sp. HMSC08F02]|uniref:ATP-dependent DNA helicase RecG n=1 Tax=Brevibacterium sp. HMSC08F02 TaxID=1581140 RepID=UPI0008A5C350|nr:ATP-dependent DNA helicase RecG [Brevibacterium sp. HMSC08F02]OFT26976.1 ATP-dependent DNA helicase RecG [Brevibacterium sp. HMSC08F02]
MKPLTDFVSSRDEKALAKLGVSSVGELLRYFPRTYIHPGTVTEISRLEAGQTAIVYATIESVNTRPMRNRRGTITEVTLADEHAEITATFFNQKYLAEQLKPGTRMVLTGDIKVYRNSLQIQNPRWLGHEDYIDRGDIENPIPIYRSNKQFASDRLAKTIRTVLDALGPEDFTDPIPAEVLADHGLPDLRKALTMIHRPKNEADVKEAMERFRFEEAFALQAELYGRRQRAKAEQSVRLPGKVDGLLASFDESLPWPLTKSQRRAGTEISQDLDSDSPMNRLLHGDVGSGKTLVAMRAMLQAVDSGRQAAIMAPTEVLAAQHYESFSRMLGELRTDDTLFSQAEGVRIALLTGSTPQAQRRKILLDLASGQIGIIVGTHALLSDTTIFAALGLVVIDEQHRFGVNQREALRTKAGGVIPHALVMTATPIPRTVAMTVFGDLDVSTLTDMPGGPKKIATHVVALGTHPHWMDRVWEVVAEHVEAGLQAYVVVSRIEDDPELFGIDSALAAIDAVPRLAGRRVDALHGQMSQEDKDAVMAEFTAGDIDVLVSTTVIEVGVDVHRARAMVILDADCFGLATLHQLRGRIGRDGEQAICFLVTSRTTDDEAVGRLSTVAGTLDGFRIAEHDVDNRREGDVLGRGQWGSRSSLRYLRVLRDEGIVAAARTAAHAYMDAHPDGTPELRAYVDDLAGDDLMEVS